jgi:hypothetical protein
MKATLLLAAVLLALGHAAAGSQESINEAAAEAAVNTTTFPLRPRPTVSLRLVGYSVPGSIGDESVDIAYSPGTQCLHFL